MHPEQCLSQHLDYGNILNLLRTFFFHIGRKAFSGTAYLLGHNPQQALFHGVALSSTYLLNSIDGIITLKVASYLKKIQGHLQETSINFIYCQLPVKGLKVFIQFILVRSYTMAD